MYVCTYIHTYLVVSNARAAEIYSVTVKTTIAAQSTETPVLAVKATLLGIH